MDKKDMLGLITVPTVHKRKLPRARTITKAVRRENAVQAIGKIEPGAEIYGFTKGQFSLIDILEHCLSEVGPSDVSICTWSAASGDISAANRLLSNGRIKSLRFIIDFSFKSRKPQFCAELVNTFGPDCIRVTSIHSKFALIAAESFSLVVRTSMNLNFNPRFENFEISDDPNMMGFMQEIVREIWATQEDSEGLTNRPSDNKAGFNRMYADSGLVAASAADLPRATAADLTPIKLF